MKYPECCYRIGNEFTDEYHSGKFVEFNARENENFFYVQSGEMLHKKRVRLTSITAETLAELARENKEWIDFLMDSDRKFLWEVTMNNVGTTKQKKDEPLGEFFLRVARERNYII